MQCPIIKSLSLSFGIGFSFKYINYVFFIVGKNEIYIYFNEFSTKKVNFQMAWNSIDVYQYHWPQKNSWKNSTHNLSFELCMQFFILYDKYYFVTNILHMLKFTNVC